MILSQLFNTVKLDNIYINKRIFKIHMELYEIYNSDVKKISPKLAKRAIRILEDIFIMATKMNKKIVQYKKIKNKDKESGVKELKKTIKYCNSLLRKFENR